MINRCLVVVCLFLLKTTAVHSAGLRENKNKNKKAVEKEENKQHHEEAREVQKQEKHLSAAIVLDSKKKNFLLHKEKRDRKKGIETENRRMEDSCAEQDIVEQRYKATVILSTKSLHGTCSPNALDTIFSTFGMAFENYVPPATSAVLSMQGSLCHGQRRELGSKSAHQKQERGGNVDQPHRRDQTPQFFHQWQQSFESSCMLCFGDNTNDHRELVSQEKEHEQHDYYLSLLRGEIHAVEYSLAEFFENVLDGVVAGGNSEVVDCLGGVGSTAYGTTVIMSEGQSTCF